MKWLRSIAVEIYGLFVDDVSFALSILGCVGMAALLLRRVPSLASFSGMVLFVALGLLLARSAVQFAAGRERGQGQR